MNVLQSYTKKYFKPVFYFLLFANISIINILIQNGELLASEHARYGMVSLELNTSKENQQDIIKEWKKAHQTVWTVTTDTSDENKTIHGDQIAWKQTRRDFVFIFLYCSLLALLFLQLAPQDRPAFLRLGLSAIILAGFLDCVENAGIFEILKNPTSSPARIFIPAYGKFALLLLTAGYLLVQMIRKGILYRVFQNLSAFVSNAFLILVKFRIVVGGLILMFFALWLSDQGRDLLLVVNNNAGGPVILLVMISILAVLNWHLPKYYATASQSNLATTGISFFKFFSGQLPPREPAQEDHRYTARLLGVLTFIIPAICILNALRLFHIPYILDEIHPFFLGLFVVVFYHLAMRHQWIDRIFRARDSGGSNAQKDGLAIRVLIFIGFIITLVFLIGILGHATATYYLAYLSLDLFLLSFAFLVFTTLRQCVQRPAARVDVISRIIILVAVAVSLIFLGLNFFTFPLGKFLRIVAIPVVFCAICFYTLVISYLLLLGRRYQIQFITLLIIIAFVVSGAFGSRFHEVEYAQIDNNAPVAVPSLPEYSRNWIKAHLAEIDSFNVNHGAYPVFFVNAYGGGIRAAAWTTLAIANLDSQLLASGSKDFQHYVFSYSTASGGTIGASVLCATRFSKINEPIKNLAPGEWSSWFENDFLTPVLVGLLGRDIWYSSFGIWKAHDRAYLQEWTWKHILDEKNVDYFKPFYSYWDAQKNPGYDIPLLFSNTYDIDGGLKGIVAPVHLDTLDFPGSVFVHELITDHGKGLRLSTAAFLSARFPVISPTGKVDEFHHFMDGGFKENSGAETSRQVMAVFAREWNLFFKDSSNKKRSLQLQMLSLPNSIGETDTLEKAKNVSELTAPLTALMNNWIGNTKKADEINRIDTATFHHSYSVLRPTQHAVKNFQPVLPLGWQISDYGLQEMDSSLFYQQKTIASLLKKIRG